MSTSIARASEVAKPSIRFARRRIDVPSFGLASVAEWWTSSEVPSGQTQTPSNSRQASMVPGVDSISILFNHRSIQKKDPWKEWGR